MSESKNNNPNKFSGLFAARDNAKDPKDGDSVSETEAATVEGQQQEHTGNTEAGADLADSQPSGSSTAKRAQQRSSTQNTQSTQNRSSRRRSTNNRGGGEERAASLRSAETESEQTLQKRPPGRPPGKRSNPDYEQATVYIRKDTHKAVKVALLQQADDRQFSELVEDLLQQWVES